MDDAETLHFIKVIKGTDKGATAVLTCALRAQLTLCLHCSGCDQGLRPRELCSVRREQ